ncbi:M24 family metallopeptidase [Chloroflexota bacterium]
MALRISRKMNNRLDLLRRGLKEKSVEAILISQSQNRRYISGFDGTAGYLLVTAQKTILATDFRYIEQAKQQTSAFEVLQTSGKLEEWLPGLTSRLGLKRLGFEADNVSFSIYNRLRDVLSDPATDIELVPLAGLVESLRAIKEPSEIEHIKKAATISDAAMDYVNHTLLAGMTEIEVAWKLEQFLRQNGSQGIPFDIIVASGTNAALPHAKPSERVIKNGEPVIIDLGASIQGYTSDISRTICPGEVDDTFRKLYAAVLKAQQMAIDGIKAGISAIDADNLSRLVIEQAGYGKQFGHGLGHGVGLAVHEKPNIGPTSKDELEDNMVFTIEPGIYIPKWGGIRIEDTVMLKNGRIEVISKTVK